MAGIELYGLAVFLCYFSVFVGYAGNGQISCSGMYVDTVAIGCFSVFVDGECAGLADFVAECFCISGVAYLAVHGKNVFDGLIVIFLDYDVLHLLSFRNFHVVCDGSKADLLEGHHLCVRQVGAYLLGVKLAIDIGIDFSSGYEEGVFLAAFKVEIVYSGCALAHHGEFSVAENRFGSGVERAFGEYCIGIVRAGL